VTTPAILAIDLGTGSVKALLIDETCKVLATASAPYPVSRPHDGWAEQDPNDWWHATVDSVRTAVAAVGDVRVVAIGLSGQMHGTVLLDREGMPVRPAIIWEDRRSTLQVRTLTERLGAERLIEVCGSPLATGFQAATLAWLVENEPDSIAHTSSVLLPADYLRLRLTGALGTEPSDASSTLLFDIRRRAWSNEVIEAVGVNPAIFPHVFESAMMTGELRPDAARELGLPVRTPIASGGADAPLAALAAGATGGDTLLLTMSTGSQAILPAAEPIIDPRGRIHTWCSLAEPGSGLPAWYQMGATLASGRALRWLREDVLASTTENLDSIVAAVPPGSDGLLFLPYLNGERTPHMDPDASGAFLGLRAHHGTTALTRAVMEGSVYALHDAYQVLEELGGEPQRIVLAGGGARSRVWTQIVADVFDFPVDPLEESEGSAMGAAIVAGAAVGWFDLAEGARRSARFGPRMLPNGPEVEIYREIQPIFRHAYIALKDDFQALGDIAARARASSIQA
jgi:xylulokinase